MMLAITAAVLLSLCYWEDSASEMQVFFSFVLVRQEPHHYSLAS